MWSNRLEDAFLTTGYSCNWKHAVSNFKCHASSAPHKEATEKISLINCNVNVAQQMERQLADEKASARRALHAVAETLLTLAHTGCAIRGHEDDEGNLMAWLQLRAGDLPDLKQLMQRRMAFLSHDIQNELLQLMSNNVLRQILGRVQNSPYFGVIVDETTDISTQEQVSMCLRYLVDDVTPTETFIGLY
jgi:Domain of unknown function (DUF4371)